MNKSAITLGLQTLETNKVLFLQQYSFYIVVVKIFIVNLNSNINVIKLNIKQAICQGINVFMENIL